VPEPRMVRHGHGAQSDPIRFMFEPPRAVDRTGQVFECYLIHDDRSLQRHVLFNTNFIQFSPNRNCI
jgi:hypothetical protein